MNVARYLLPLLRSFEQLGDWAFLGVVLRGVLLSAIFFGVTGAVAFWLIHHFTGGPWILRLLLDALGVAAVGIAAMWLFVPIAAGVSGFYLERVAIAVEHLFYPDAPGLSPAPIPQQLRDCIAIGVRVLLLNTVALFLTLIIPGLGFIAGWLITSWAMGRSLLVAVAMRRMNRDDAKRFHDAFKVPATLYGALMVAAAYIPLLNLFVPVLGAAAMVHIFHIAPGRRN